MPPDDAMTQRATGAPCEPLGKAPATDRSALPASVPGKTVRTVRLGDRFFLVVVR